MAKNLQKLELTWIGKGEQPKLEPRILIEDPEKSYGSNNTENMLIFGDNLLALKALEQNFTGKIKCIYIDPPYNTGNAFEHYEDGVEHSLWLSLMRDRLNVLKKLLRPDGFICCQIDDSEGHYLKVLLDEVFERNNYLTSFYIQVRYPEKTLKQDMDFHKEVEQIHVYRKKYGAKPNLNEKMSSFDKFNFYIEELKPGTETVIGNKRAVIFNKGDFKIVKKEGSALGLKEIWATGTILDGNSSGRFFRDYLTGRVINDGLGVLYKIYGIGDDSFDYRYFTGPQRANATKGKYFQGVPNSQLENPDKVQTTPIENFYDLAGSFGNCRSEGNADFRGGKKPELLIQKIISHFSNSGDWVLDSFAGSGTTGAVAHKMNRKWIMVELGEHCHTHIIPRISRVCDGIDQTGISSQVAWKGGGGFKYYYMAPSLLKKDRFDQWIINSEYNPTMLAAAMAKHESFRYCPDEVFYWKQGRSSEKDYIFTTTTHIMPEHLDKIYEEMQPDEHLLICCKSYFAGADERYSNISVKKIPSMLLGKCEFGRDDYSLNIVNMPHNPDEPEFVPTGPPVSVPKIEDKDEKAVKAGQLNIFTGTGEYHG
ncbi:MAG: site-specific DNA-methyltransferase [Chlorobium sp.]|nr:site-specific DNA-methyltransferase [Chlorobium sp.]